jgi:hypothetical protein
MVLPRIHPNHPLNRLPADRIPCHPERSEDFREAEVLAESKDPHILYRVCASRETLCATSRDCYHFSANSAFSAVQWSHPAYIAITRSIARRQTAQNALCRVNMMQSTSGR